MGRCCIGSIDGAAATHQDLIKQPDDIGPGFFSQIVIEKHVFGTFDHILHNPFPEVVRQCNPINQSISLSVPFPKRICLQFPDKDEIALFGSQHHIIPIDDKHMVGMIAYQIGWMQVRVTDDVWP